MKKTGLYFGSFNPIHNGHLALGHYFLKNSPLDEIRFIISPQNPLKRNQNLLPEKARLEMVRCAIEELAGFSYSTIEFELSKPNYTYDTLKFITQKEPLTTFSLLMGEDNLSFFHQWKNYTEILELVTLYIYPRANSEPAVDAFSNHPKIKWFKAPILDFSATDIRERIHLGKTIAHLIPDAVRKEIQAKQYYS